MPENNEILHLPANPGFHWAKVNEETGLKEFFVCVDSGYYKREDYELIENSEMNAYIDEFYPKPEPMPEEYLEEEHQEESNE